MHMFMPGQEYFVIGKQLKTEKRNALLPCLKLLVILETQSVAVSYSETLCLITSRPDNITWDFYKGSKCFCKDS